jgi:uncharacterized membrane protein YdjX (TVP38/TMEM64 family)
MTASNLFQRIIRSKQFWLMAGVVCLSILFASAPLQQLLDRDLLANFLEILGPWSIGIFLLGHIVVAVLNLPGSIWVALGGAVFGVLWGSILSVTGASLGAIAAFLLSRHLLRDWFLQRFHQHKILLWFDRLSDRQALLCVLAIRFTPISPFGLVNLLLGLTPVALRPYALGTCVGIIPGTTAYTWLGAAGSDALEGEGWLSLVCALCALAALSLLPLLLKRNMPN